LAEQVQRSLMEFQHPVLSIQKSRTPATYWTSAGDTTLHGGWMQLQRSSRIGRVTSKLLWWTFK